MTCNACGEKPKDTAKDFTKAVVEINNPETLVLLRKVVIPASMGTEEDVPAAIGKYHNVILYYEANKHTYLYSSDGIPTLLETEIPQELLDRISELEEGLEQEITTREGTDEELQSNIDAVAQDLEDFKNSPDVVDIVPTYAALQAYDTSKLGDNDEIRVLADETHDGASAYYRWDKTNSQWIFIGITGPYYTKSEIDTTVQGIEGDIEDVQTALENKRVEAQILTTEDYDWPTSNPDGVAIWKLPYGAYRNENGVKYYTSADASGTRERLFLVFPAMGSDSDSVILRAGYINGGDGRFDGPYVERISPDGIKNTTYSGNVLTTAQVVNNLTSSYGLYALSANQGRILNGKIGDLSSLSTTDKTNLVAAINEVAGSGGGGPTVVQTTGSSTTDVMSQNAATNLVYRDPSNLQQIQVGKNASASGSYAISIGGAATSSGASSASGNYSIAIGNGARTSKYQSIVIGYNAQTGPYDASNCISIGSYAYPTKGDCVAIGPGLNSSSDRVIINSDRGVAIGYCAKISGTGLHNSVAIGAFSDVTRKGEVSVGCPNGYNYGYNDTRYRVIGGVYDGQSAHDAATYGQVISYSAINGAGTPTTATEGKYVGQLYYDTTNEAMYFLKTIDATTTPTTYTWEALGGGSSVSVVQVTGTSTTDVMSQVSASQMIFPSGFEISKDRIAVGDNAVVSAAKGIAIGQRATSSHTGSVAIGHGAITHVVGEVNIGSTYNTSYGYNNTSYRLLTGLHDPVNAHDAATKGYVDAVAPVVTMTATDPGEGVPLAANNFIGVYDA